MNWYEEDIEVGNDGEYGSGRRDLGYVGIAPLRYTERREAGVLSWPRNTGYQGCNNDANAEHYDSNQTNPNHEFKPRHRIEDSEIEG
jgi:hypothetical protein